MRLKIGKATTAKTKRTPAKERIETDHDSQKDKERRNLIGKKSHHDGIIIEKRNDPREMGRTKAGKSVEEHEIARAQVKIRDQVNKSAGNTNRERYKTNGDGVINQRPIRNFE
jgi:hypothetical protein